MIDKLKEIQRLRSKKSELRVLLNSIESRVVELREEILEVLVNDETRPLERAVAYCIGDSAALVEINEEFYEFCKGHDKRISISFIPLITGGAA